MIIILKKQSTWQKIKTAQRKKDMVMMMTMTMMTMMMMMMMEKQKEPEACGIRTCCETDICVDIHPRDWKADKREKPTCHSTLGETKNVQVTTTV